MSAVNSGDSGMERRNHTAMSAGAAPIPIMIRHDLTTAWMQFIALNVFPIPGHAVSMTSGKGESGESDESCKQLTYGLHVKYSDEHASAVSSRREFYCYSERG